MSDNYVLLTNEEHKKVKLSLCLINYFKEWICYIIYKYSCSKFRIGKRLSDRFLIQNGTKQGEALSPLLFNFAFEYAIRMVQEYQVGKKR
jgi:hypothetical protein